MAGTRQNSSSAFQDDFTQARGTCFFVSVEPVFHDQISEAVTLIARSRPENVRVSYISQFVAAAKTAAPTPDAGESPEGEEADENEEEEEKEAEPESEETREAKRKVFKDMLASIKGLTLQGTDKEFDGFANLLLSLLLALFPATHPHFSSLVLALADSLSFSSERTANPSLAARYSALSSVFNSLPLPTATISSSDADTSLPTPSATLRIAVLLKLIGFATANDDLPVVRPALLRLESWLREWGFGAASAGEEEGHAAIKRVVSALTTKSHNADARALLLQHLAAPVPAVGKAVTPSASAGQLASTLIALSLALPDVFDFSSLATIPAVAHASVPALSDLLAIFHKGDVAAFEAFVPAHKDVLVEHKLDEAALARKLKLLALAELCSGKVGEAVSYAEIAQALRLAKKDVAEDDGEEVETWVIDAIRASLISGRLSQPLLSFHVTRAAPRAFTPAHWSQLQGRLEGWRSSLDEILDSVSKGLQVDGGAGAGAVEVREAVAGGARREEVAQMAVVA